MGQLVDDPFAIFADCTLDDPAASPIPRDTAERVAFGDLTLSDSDVLSALAACPSRPARLDYLRSAIKIGVLAMANAKGTIDATRVRDEGARLVSEVENRLHAFQTQTSALIAATLREYFDPQDGKFNERVDRLIRQDGEIERVLRGHLSHSDRVLSDTLVKHVGEASPVLQMLSPNESNRFIATLRGSLDAAVAAQNRAILSEFTLDNQGSALSRLTQEIQRKQTESAETMRVQVSEVVKEFSLDDENSALSRLIRKVEAAQRKISDEFTLDVEHSALARLRRELFQVLDTQQRSTQEFQTRVVAELEGMRAKRKAEEKSTTHGFQFQDAGIQVLQGFCQNTGDVVTDTGATTGAISRSKVGDAVIVMSPDSAAPGARIVFEFKEDKSYSIQMSLDELAVAKQNRTADVGVFVHSMRTAPVGCEAFTRYGNDVLIVWDSEQDTDAVWMKAALSVAKALVLRTARDTATQTADFLQLEKSVHAIIRQSKVLDDIRTWSNTIKSSAEKVLGKIDAMQKVLVEETDSLNMQIEALKQR